MIANHLHFNPGNLRESFFNRPCTALFPNGILDFSGSLFAKISFLFIVLWLAPGIRARAELAQGNKNLGSILFLGDSITQGGSDNDPTKSVRSCLYQLLVSGGYVFDYTGHTTLNSEGLPVTGNTPSSNIYQYHSGVAGSVIGSNVLSGSTISRYGLTQSLPLWWQTGRLAIVKPNLILLMIGTNDVDNSIDLANAPQRLTTLLNTIFAQPSVGNPTILVASIPPNRRTATNINAVNAYNAAIPGVVKYFQNLNRDVYFVDQFTTLNNNFSSTMISSNNLHPNGNGDLCVAQNWYTAIQELTRPELSLAPIADSTVRDGSYAASNYGSANTLLSKTAAYTSYTRQIYLKFGLTGVNGSFSQAKLWLYGGRYPSGPLVSVVEDARGVASENWTENALTWKNKPAFTNLLSSATISSTNGQWVQWDVSSYVLSKLAAGSASVSIAVMMDQPPALDATYDSFNSKEAATNFPQLVLTPATPVTQPVPAPSSSTVHSATANSYVRDGSNAGKNFGTEPTLLSKTSNYSGYTREIYLKFDLNNLPANPSQVILRLWGNRSPSGTSTTTADQSVYGTSNDNWTETGLTWNNRPHTTTNALDSVAVTGFAGSWYEWDVTSYVLARKSAGSSTVTLVVAMDMPPSGDENYDIFNSRTAASNQPQLLFNVSQ